MANSCLIISVSPAAEHEIESKFVHIFGRALSCKTIIPSPCPFVHHAKASMAIYLCFTVRAWPRPAAVIETSVEAVSSQHAYVSSIISMWPTDAVLRMPELPMKCIGYRRVRSPLSSCCLQTKHTP